MRLGKQIFSFLAVAVLLSFFGKVSKTDLFHVFIRTIQEVELRNSTAHFHSTGEKAEVQSSVTSKSRASSYLNLFSKFSRIENLSIPFSTQIESVFSRLYFLTVQFTAAP